MTTLRPKTASALALALMLLAFGVPAAFAEDGAAAGPAKKVETQKVCMVNDALFAKDQIPVEVEGKTYYGCCDMCKARLAQDASIRSSADPVTGAAVDKATAVPAALADGTVLYFESEETLAQYNEKDEGEAEAEEADSY